MAKVYQAIGNKERAEWQVWSQAKQNSSPKALVVTK